MKTQILLRAAVAAFLAAGALGAIPSPAAAHHRPGPVAYGYPPAPPDPSACWEWLHHHWVRVCHMGDYQTPRPTFLDKIWFWDEDALDHRRCHH